ncbi:collagen-like protein [Sphaerisporangium perillae]|uniref:collagen-like protein n=1 Tax=Sphaerisporangium perillae TaxID=2935860 RepID=UPI00200C05F6|nr:collagen-like protein [Sphaerisporangium perillae]
MAVKLPGGRLLAAAGVGVLAGSIIAGGFAYAAGANSPVYACVDKSSHLVRIVGVTTKCKTTEVKTSWNRQGPEGPAGSPGTTGATGPRGLQGPKGADGKGRCAGGQGRHGFAGPQG